MTVAPLRFTARVGSPGPGTRTRGRTLAGALLALGAAVVLFLIVLGTAPSGSRPGATPARAETVVYRVDTQADDGTWDVREWGVAHGPRRAGVMQARSRACLREAPTHRCRLRVEARFTDVDAARERKGALCRVYVQRHGHRPPGMPAC